MKVWEASESDKSSEIKKKEEKNRKKKFKSAEAEVGVKFSHGLCVSRFVACDASKSI